jgi:D-beta-D-heptose 7-phosphate kinase/D-beta-D-heptose 1-phosphate adenosyltransferase
VKGYGGEVKVLDFIDDISTTKIVERIRKDNE